MLTFKTVFDFQCGFKMCCSHLILTSAFERFGSQDIRLFFFPRSNWTIQNGGRRSLAPSQQHMTSSSHDPLRQLFLFVFARVFLFHLKGSAFLVDPRLICDCFNGWIFELACGLYYDLCMNEMHLRAQYLNMWFPLWIQQRTPTKMRMKNRKWMLKKNCLQSKVQSSKIGWNLL